MIDLLQLQELEDGGTLGSTSSRLDVLYRFETNRHDCVQFVLATAVYIAFIRQAHKSERAGNTATDAAQARAARKVDSRIVIATCIASPCWLINAEFTKRSQTRSSLSSLWRRKPNLLRCGMVREGRRSSGPFSGRMFRGGRLIRQVAFGGGGGGVSVLVENSGDRLA